MDPNILESLLQGLPKNGAPQILGSHQLSGNLVVLGFMVICGVADHVIFTSKKEVASLVSDFS